RRDRRGRRRGGGAPQSRSHGPPWWVPPARRRIARVQFDRVPARSGGSGAMRDRWWALLWAAAVLAACAARPQASRPGGGGAGGRFVRRVDGIAALNGGAPDRLDAVGLVEAAICQDDTRIDALAGGDASTLRVVAQIAAVPLLTAAAQTIGASVSAAWWEGYCPVCGAWRTRRSSAASSESAGCG